MARTLGSGDHSVVSGERSGLPGKLLKPATI
jgi:hypothetical protein